MDSLELDMPEYISAGGNRHPAAADWDSKTGLLAFGADRNVALWQPKVCLDFSSVSAPPAPRLLLQRVRNSVTKLWVMSRDAIKRPIEKEQG